MDSVAQGGYRKHEKETPDVVRKRGDVTIKLLVTGATGFIGRALVRRLAERGHVITALSRDPQRARKELPQLAAAYGWERASAPVPGEALVGVDGVVHLAGESVAGRWTAAKRAEIYHSRVDGTRRLVEAIAAAAVKPKVLVSMSAIGYYGNQGERELTEEDGPGEDFLATVCRDWEREALRAAELGVRVVRLRCGIVLGLEGGALRSLLLPARLGLGGPLGPGTQWWSWVHREDIVRLIEHALVTDLEGSVNGTAPRPVRQREFARILGRQLRRPAILPAPAWALRLVLGGFACEVLDSKRVLPRRALASGFRFRFERLEAALADILAKNEKSPRR